jgi:hypothetical protein
LLGDAFGAVAGFLEDTAKAAGDVVDSAGGSLGVATRDRTWPAVLPCGD